MVHSLPGWWYTFKYALDMTVTSKTTYVYAFVTAAVYSIQNIAHLEVECI